LMVYGSRARPTTATFYLIFCSVRLKQVFQLAIVWIT